MLDRRFVARKSACEIDKDIDALEFVHDVCNQAACLDFVSQGCGERQYPCAALPEFGSARINIALRARANSELARARRVRARSVELRAAAGWGGPPARGALAGSFLSALHPIRVFPFSDPSNG